MRFSRAAMRLTIPTPTHPSNPVCQRKTRRARLISEVSEPPATTFFIIVYIFLINYNKELHLLHSGRPTPRRALIYQGGQAPPALSGGRPTPSARQWLGVATHAASGTLGLTPVQQPFGDCL